MKELSGTARNLALVKEDGEYHPVVELIFVVSEPAYKFTVGEMVRERVPDTIRISTNIGGVRRVIESLKDIEKELEKMQTEAAAAELCGEAKAHRPTAQGVPPVEVKKEA